MIQWSVLNWNEPSLKFYDRIGAVKVDDWQVRRLAGTAMTTLAGGMAKYG
jgi:hypothetical protein